MTAAEVRPHVSKAGAITALTFWNLKQITIKQTLGIGKTCCISLQQHGSCIGIGINSCFLILWNRICICCDD